MKNLRIVLAVAMGAGIGLLGITQAASQKTSKGATSQTGSLLSGTIRSTSGAEEGITVSARVEGSTVTTSVFTGADGFYVFPPLPQGKYQVWAQATGLDTGRADVSLDGSKPARQDFSLQPIKDITKQMTGADWFNSLPEDTIQDRRVKDVLYTNCTGCHEPNYPLQNRFDKAGWTAIMDLMKSVSVVGTVNKNHVYPILQYHEQEFADYLARAHGPGPSSLKVNIVSRPKGEATLAVVTEYAIEPGETPGELPLQDGSIWSEGVPTSLNGVRGTHDAEIDFAGNMWVVNSQPNPNRTYAKIDGKTGLVTSYKVLDNYGRPRTSHGLRKDKNGILWFNLRSAGGQRRFRTAQDLKDGLARLDPISGKLDIYAPPDPMEGVGGSIDIDGKGKIWAPTDDGAIRFDPDTGKFMEFKSTMMKKEPECFETSCGTTYGVAGDAEGNGYWAQMAFDIVGKGNVATGKTTDIKMPPRAEKMEIVTADERKLYDTTTSDWNSAIPWSQGPRRLSGDHAGTAVWVANSWGDNLGKIDIHTSKVTMYPTPTKYAGIYSTVVDKNHVVWSNMMNSDTVAKFDPATGKWTEYMLPSHGAESRHIAIDDRQSPTIVVVPYSRSSKVALFRFRTKQDLQSLRKQAQAERLQAEVR